MIREAAVRRDHGAHGYTYSPGRRAAAEPCERERQTQCLFFFIIIFWGSRTRTSGESGVETCTGCVAAGECEEVEEADKKGPERRNEWEQMRWKGLEIVVSWLAVACVGL